jgi:DNA polymerase I-like protein with 3'-5' exonuclease and polymerase domains
VEWQLLGEVMRNRNITKVAVDIKSKMTCLRELDVIVRGPLEDPSIAKALLPRDFEMSLKLPDTWKSTQNSSVKVACFRAAAVIRTMATLTSELRRHHQLELFRTVEMPLLHSVSEIDYVGCPAETSFFRDLLQNLVDRQTIIKSYFDSIDKNFNPLSNSLPYYHGSRM